MLPIIREHGIRRIRPFDFFDGVPRLFENFFPEADPVAKLGNLDVYEDENNLYVEVELPGFEKDQIELTLEDGLLSLSAQRQLENKEKKNNYYIRERRSGQWSRTLQLPVAVLEDKVQAVFQEGLLKVTLEKQPQSKAHKIDVK